MNTISRRHLMLAGGASFVSNALPLIPIAESKSLPKISGCILHAGELSQFSMSQSSDVANAFSMSIEQMSEVQKRALGRSLVRISELFNVKPSFSFFDDGARLNAYASPDTRPGGQFGSVVFGRNLFKQQMESYDDSGMSVIAICAHEFGHILQFSTGYDDYLRRGQNTVKLVELQADFFSGYFLGCRKRAGANISLLGAGKTIRRMGDYAFDNPDHHGTPDQRVSSAEAGFKLGYDETAQSLEKIIRYSAEFVKENY